MPVVLATDSLPLDLGRTARLFTAAQRIALAERDCGCAFCGAPPSYTQAHHIRWWKRDEGPSNLDNGVLLCWRDHRRI
ncbi:HNH endonuclease, partial [Rhizobium johnstonii]|uniref:HNH endonuclease n=1 Tax=Rhizobium johnstonii TaxID=3019933 RepID=UPI003F953A31